MKLKNIGWFVCVIMLVFLSGCEICEKQKTKITELEGRITVVNKEKADLMHERDMLKKEVEEINESLSQTRDDLSAVESTCENLKTESAELQKQLQDVKQSLSQAEIVKKNNDSLINELRSSLETQTNNSKIQQDEIEKLKKILSSIRSELDLAK